MVAAAGITVGEAMQLRSLAGARVVAGQAGRQRVIRSVNMMEVPDIAAYVREGELLVTTAYPLRDDMSALTKLVPLLAARRLAGLALKPGRYIGTIPGPVVVAADRLKFPVIELPPEASFNDVLADVLGTILNRQALQLERSRAIHDRLSAVAMGGGSLPELLRALVDLIHHPAAIVDARGQLLASVPAPLPVTLDSRRREAREIRVGVEFHGQIVVWPDQELDPDAALAVEQATTIAALQMAQARAIVSREQRYRVSFLHELVSGHAVDREAVLQRAAAFGWDLEQRRSALLAELETPGGGSIEVAGKPPEEQLMRCVQAVLGPGAIAWGLRSGLAALATLADGDAGTKVASALAKEIRRAQPRVQVSIAIGGVGAEFMELPRSYREAQEAMAIGRDLYPPGFVIRHSDLGLLRLLFQLSTEQLTGYCEETLGPLLEYDRRHNGALVKTLETYLRSGRNIARSARQLSVHYNTLRYRLGQIELLTGGMDRHATSRLGLELGLQMRTVLSAKQGRARPQTSSPGVG